MLSDLPPTLKINEVNKICYTDTRQCLSEHKKLMFLKNIPTMLLWKIFKVFRVSFGFYHLYTLFAFIMFHLSAESPFKVAVFLPISLANLWSILEDCLNPQYCSRENTSMKFQKGNLNTLQLNINFKNPTLKNKNLHHMHNIH